MRLNIIKFENEEPQDLYKAWAALSPFPKQRTGQTGADNHAKVLSAPPTDSNTIPFA